MIQVSELSGQTSKQRIKRTLYIQIDVSNERLNKSNVEGEGVGNICQFDGLNIEKRGMLNEYCHKRNKKERYILFLSFAMKILLLIFSETDLFTTQQK
jgi:hypothetical protein